MFFHFMLLFLLIFIESNEASAESQPQALGATGKGKKFQNPTLLPEEPQLLGAKALTIPGETWSVGAMSGGSLSQSLDLPQVQTGDNITHQARTPMGRSPMANNRKNSPKSPLLTWDGKQDHPFPVDSQQHGTKVKTPSGSETPLRRGISMDMPESDEDDQDDDENKVTTSAPPRSRYPLLQLIASLVEEKIPKSRESFQQRRTKYDSHTQTESKYIESSPTGSAGSASGSSDKRFSFFKRPKHLVAIEEATQIDKQLPPVPTQTMLGNDSTPA